MGNAASATATHGRGRNRVRNSGQKWVWEYRNGRYQPKPVTTATTKPKLKWVKQRSNNHDWWIFNPDRKNNSNDGWPALFGGNKRRGTVRG